MLEKLCILGYQRQFGHSTLDHAAILEANVRNPLNYNFTNSRFRLRNSLLYRPDRTQEILRAIERYDDKCDAQNSRHRLHWLEHRRMVFAEALGPKPAQAGTEASKLLSMLHTMLNKMTYRGGAEGMASTALMDKTPIFYLTWTLVKSLLRRADHFRPLFNHLNNYHQISTLAVMFVLHRQALAHYLRILHESHLFAHTFCDSGLLTNLCNSVVLLRSSIANLRRLIAR